MQKALPYVKAGPTWSLSNTRSAGPAIAQRSMFNSMDPSPCDGSTHF